MKGVFGGFLPIMGVVAVFFLAFALGASTDKVNPQEEEPQELIFTREKPSPQDWIKEENIHVYKDKVVIDIDNPQWARFTDTNSMDPIFDSESHAIEIVPTDPEMIQAGDIVSFAYGEDTIIHRVIKTDYDDDGWYMLTKGDNNPNPDPSKIRFDQVRRLVVAIIY